MAAVKGLLDRLKDGETVICAEGYTWELERRGCVKSGVFTPEIVVDHPEKVSSLHEEFVLAGSDVVEAFTYYAQGGKLKAIGRDQDYKQINLNSLKLARDVADRYGKLMAGNICNTGVFDPNDVDNQKMVSQLFKEQVQWAVTGHADYMVGETFNDFAEAKLALEMIRKYGNGLPAVITLSVLCPEMTLDDVPFVEALRRLEELGADVVGLNCSRGPRTMMPLLRKAREVCKGPMAALPVAFRTDNKEKTFFALTDPRTGDIAYPHNLSCRQCGRTDIRQFAKEAQDLGIQYVGICCGSSPKLLRELAEAYGRKPPASVYSPDMTRHMAFGEEVKGHNMKKRQYMMGEIRNLKVN